MLPSAIGPWQIGGEGAARGTCCRVGQRIHPQLHATGCASYYGARNISTSSKLIDSSMAVPPASLALVLLHHAVPMLAPAAQSRERRAEPRVLAPRCGRMRLYPTISRVPSCGRAVPREPQVSLGTIRSASAEPGGTGRPALPSSAALSTRAPLDDGRLRRGTGNRKFMASGLLDAEACLACNLAFIC